MKTNNSNRVSTSQDEYVVTFDLPHELNTLEASVLVILPANWIQFDVRGIIGHHREVVGLFGNFGLDGNHRQCGSCIQFHTCPSFACWDFDEVSLGVVWFRVVAQDGDHSSLQG